MDLALMTVIIAILFSAMGVVVGFLIGKLSCKKSEAKSISSIGKERIEGILNNVEDMVSNLKVKVDSLREERINDMRNEIKRLLTEVEEFKKEIKNVGVSQSTLEILDEISNTLKKIDLSIPNIDNSLLQKIKDNFLIVRNDLETILTKCKSQSNTSQDYSNFFASLIDKVDAIISLSKRINATLVKDELIALAHSIKGDDGTEIVKDLDNQALHSKELLVMLEDLKKRIEEVKNESSLR